MTDPHSASEPAGHEHAHTHPGGVKRLFLLLEVEGYVAAATTVTDAEALGRRVETAVIAAVPESRAVLWSPRSVPSHLDR